MSAVERGNVRAQARQRSRDLVDRAAFAQVLACFFLSGVAALLYETAWVRQFSIVFGTSELAVASVLAAYMAGLALGAGVAGRMLPRIKRPILVYALLEVGIALGALAVPLGMSLARRLQESLFGGQAQPPDAGATGATLFHLASAFVVLVIPTGLMGATLPLLARHAIHSRDQIGARIGLLYAANTGGAVLGTLLTAFVLLPAVGLRATVLAGIAINACVFLLAAAVSRRSAPLDGAKYEPATPPPGASIAGKERRRASPTGEADDDVIDDRRAWLVLPLVFASGVASFTYEVLWSRLVGHLLGGSLQAFATMLASFLIGIMLGSAVAARLATTRAGAVRGLISAQFGAALLSIGVYHTLDGLPALARWLASVGVAGWATDALIAGAAMLPAALCLGATFPLAVRILARDSHQAGAAAARVFAWNTVGAIAGAILAGFVVVPELGFAGAARFAVGINLAVAVVAVWAIARPGAMRTLASAGAAAAIALLFQPSPPDAALRASRFAGLSSAGDVVYSAAGESSTVLLLEQDGNYYLRTNGLPESAIAARGELPGFAGLQEALTALPLLTRPRAASMLLVGLGGGGAIEEVPASVREIDVIELEPRVIDANRAISRLRQRDPLADPRVRMILNDARGALALTTKRYDVIVSQPSHPWTAGASHLYTREFFQEARAHLSDRGVFVAWMEASFVDRELLRSLSATLLDSFGHVRLYRPQRMTLLFLCSDAPIDPERSLMDDAAPLDWPICRRLGLLTIEDMVAWLSLDESGMRHLASDAAVNTDNNNLLGMRPPPTAPVESLLTEIEADLAQWDPVAARPAADGATANLDWVYVARRLTMHGMPRRAAALAARLPNQIDRLLAVGQAARLDCQEEVAIQAFREVLRQEPNHPEALFALVEPWLPALAAGTAPPEIVAAAARLTGSPAAVVAGWRHAARQEHDQLAALEPTLAEVSPTSACYPKALRLRAVWRTSTALADRQPDDAAAALDLLDIAIALAPHQPDCLVERMNAALAADRPDIWLATAAELARELKRADSSRPTPSADFIRGISRVSLSGLDRLETDGRVPPRRVRAVRDDFLSLQGAAP